MQSGEVTLLSRTVFFFVEMLERNAVVCNRICLRCEREGILPTVEIDLCEECLVAEFPEGLIQQESMASCNFCGEPRGGEQ